MRLWQYTVIHTPKVTRDAQGNETQGKAQLVVEPTWHLASTEQEVVMVAARAIPPGYVDKMDELEVAVRPF